MHNLYALSPRKISLEFSAVWTDHFTDETNKKIEKKRAYIIERRKKMGFLSSALSVQGLNSAKNGILTAGM